MLILKIIFITNSIYLKKIYFTWSSAMFQLENGLYTSFYKYSLSMFENYYLNTRFYSNINDYIKYNTICNEFNMHFFRSLFICLYYTGIVAIALFSFKFIYLYIRNNHHQIKLIDFSVIKTNYIKKMIQKIFKKI